MSSHTASGRATPPGWLAGRGRPEDGPESPRVQIGDALGYPPRSPTPPRRHVDAGDLGVELSRSLRALGSVAVGLRLCALRERRPSRAVPAAGRVDPSLERLPPEL